jgi:hypothetical protein
VAFTALFVALGGSSYAITKLPDNSVGTRQLKARAVTLVKLDPKVRHSITRANPKLSLRVGQEGSNGTSQANCFSGETATGGGGVVSSYPGFVTMSYPTLDGTGWTFGARRPDGSLAVDVQAWVICESR